MNMDLTPVQAVLLPLSIACGIGGIVATLTLFVALVWEWRQEMRRRRMQRFLVAKAMLRDACRDHNSISVWRRELWA